MDEIFCFTPSDEEIEALVSMSPEEVDAELIELGLDPDAPLPERIKNLIAAQEDQKAGSSAGGTLHYISAEAEKLRFKQDSLKKQRGQAIRKLLRQCAAALLISGVLGLTYLSSNLRNQQLAPVKSASVPTPPVSKPQLSKGMEDNLIYTSAHERTYRQATKPQTGGHRRERRTI